MRSAAPNHRWQELRSRQLVSPPKLPLPSENSWSYYSPLARFSQDPGTLIAMVVFFRAVVMLVVLVGLPAAWVYYGPLPPGAQRVVGRVVDVVREVAGWQQPAQPHDIAVAPPPKFPSDSIVLPAVATQPVNGESTNLPAAPTQTEVNSNAAELATQVEPLLRQLRDLGSSEYTLEPWGREGRLFRFRCEVPLVQDKQFTQQFEAVAKTPQASIEQVVGQVTCWKRARLNGRQPH